MMGKGEKKLKFLYLKSTDAMPQWNMTRIFALTRSGVVRPRVTCAAAVRHFLAEALCCRTLFCDDDGAITLPLAASPGELHLTFQPPKHCCSCSEKPQRSKKKKREEKKTKKKPRMVRGGEGRVGTRDLRRSSRTPPPRPSLLGNNTAAALRTTTSEALQADQRVPS